MNDSSIKLMVNAGSLTTHTVRHPRRINWSRAVTIGLLIAVIALIVIR
jgi:hypothetical protein